MAIASLIATAALSGYYENLACFRFTVVSGKAPCVQRGFQLQMFKCNIARNASRLHLDMEISSSCIDTVQQIVLIIQGIWISTLPISTMAEATFVVTL